MEKAITEACQFLDIKHKIGNFNFTDDVTSQAPVIHIYTRGVYIIVDEATSETVYVGKGWVVNRIAEHRRKINKLSKNATSSYRSWVEFFQNFEKNVDNWKVYYIEVNSETEMTALEGILIHKFKPHANDEVYFDEASKQYQKEHPSSCFNNSIYGVKYACVCHKVKKGY